MPFGALHRSGQARTALENTRPSRARSGVARTLSPAELEDWLERNVRNQGEDELLRIRDEARKLATTLALGAEREKLDGLIAALLGTGETARLETAPGRARGRREPFDAARASLFEGLHGALAGHLSPRRAEVPDPRRAFSFFEAYFSNFIEGTEFEVDEAERIVFGGYVPGDRPADAHDVLGTFEVITDPELRTRVPEDAEDFAGLLKTLNRRILESRPAKRPGEWKQAANRVGGTSFVAPGLVAGTLREAWGFYDTLPAGFARAVFAGFAVTEVHPFADGNGRVARVLINAELSAPGLCRAVIPLSFRSDYLGALRAMSRRATRYPYCAWLTGRSAGPRWSIGRVSTQRRGTWRGPTPSSTRTSPRKRV